MRTIGLSLLFLAIGSAAHADSLRSQILASDKKITAAMKKKDFATLEKSIKSGVTPDFVYMEEGVSGKGQNFDQMFANMKAGIAQIGKLTVVDSKLLSLKEKGNVATATTAHTMGGIMSGPDKKSHTMTMAGTSTETYVKVGSKWKMSKMVWKNGAMKMDGKPMKMG